MRAPLFRCGCLLSLLIASSASAATIDWTLVGDPGNAGDPQTGSGAVGYAYAIGTYEVTNAQYTEFLNAVGDTDPNGLYNPNMQSTANWGGIQRSGADGSYAYNAIAERENMPVNWVSFYDAVRFVNWLQNGQPTGVQDVFTTESGAYTLTLQGISDSSITRNPSATVFLPNQNEWYKAAYYDSVGSSYFVYPTSTNTPTVCSPPTATPNRANCNRQAINPQHPYGDLTDVGSYTGSSSPYGTFDQGGNVAEWNETVVQGFDRGVSGHGFNVNEAGLEAMVPTIRMASRGFLAFAFR